MPTGTTVVMTVGPFQVGVRGYFTIEVTPSTSTNHRNVRLALNSGDGTDDLFLDVGVIQGKQTLSHVYGAAGRYTAVATVSDSAAAVSSRTSSSFEVTVY